MHKDPAERRHVSSTRLTTFRVHCSCLHHISKWSPLFCLSSEVEQECLGELACGNKGFQLYFCDSQACDLLMSAQHLSAVPYVVAVDRKVLPHLPPCRPHSFPQTLFLRNSFCFASTDPIVPRSPVIRNWNRMNWFSLEPLTFCRNNVDSL